MFALSKIKTALLKSRKQPDMNLWHPDTDFDELSLLGLPSELLRKIIQNLDAKDWLSLCLTCRYLHIFVEKYFLYQNVKIRSKHKLMLFKKSLSKDKKTNARSLYVSRIEFQRPEKECTKVETTSIAGFSYSSQQNYNSDSYIALLLEVISLLPNLQDINLRYIPSGFQFPEWSSSLKTYAHEHNYYPSIRKLRLSSEESWVIPLRPNLLWPFGLIEELVLYDMIIDSNSLKKPRLLTLANERGPLITKEALKSESLETWSPIKVLTLKECTFVNSASRYLSGYFVDLKVLRLLSLKSYYDLLLSHCFPSLIELQIDLNSKCFSLYNPQEVHSINVMNQNSNYSYYNSKFVPNFYMHYSNFQEVLQKLPRNVEKITLVNVSFTNIKPIDPESEPDEDNNLPNNNLFHFLNLLKDYCSVEFIMLKSYKLHQPRSKRDWEDLLSICFTSTNSVRVKDKDGSVLFSRNEKY